MGGIQSDIFGGPGGGGFMGLLGPEGMGLTGSTSAGTQRTTLDPWTRLIDQIVGSNLANADLGTGGLGTLYPQYLQTAQLAPQTNELINSIIAQSQQTGLDPTAWYNQAKADLNPEASIQAGQNILRDIVQPELQGEYSLMGMGRSGASQEALAKAGEQIALPIAQQQLQNLFSLNQQYPGVDTALRGASLGRLQQGLGASDYARSAANQTYGTALQNYIKMLIGAPYQGAPTVYQQGTGNQGLISSVFGGGGGGAAVGGAMKFMGI